jgi:hypothetical protein
MGRVRGMHSEGRRKCCHCKEFFLPDPRNRHHQRYCGEPACRRVSKAASQRKWESQPENRDYYRGPEKAAKVRAWRAAHPGYWKGRQQKSGALPDVLITQTPAVPSEAKRDGDLALPEAWTAQAPLLVGLIAHFTGIALPEDIAVVTNRLVARGQALLGQTQYENRETNPIERTTAPVSGAVFVR